MHASHAFIASTILAVFALSGCGGSSSTSPNLGFKDPRDGQTYDLVKIGTQTWFAENLDYKGTGTDTVGVCSGFLTDNCDLYGRLYTWAEALNLSLTLNTNLLGLKGRFQGVCPSGSHVPSDSEWVVLDSAVHGKGERLESQVWNGNDTTGFGALPGGSRQYTGGFAVLGTEAYFWTSTEYNAAYGTYRYFLDTDSLVHVASYYKTSALSVRCLVN
ncbi:MAG TPA: FISUMP domain-containing protein [Fibrobacteria bacterium]|nr:FISUMP domain-containing protein [Fibrobacteria bacterium]